MNRQTPALAAACGIATAALLSALPTGDASAGTVLEESMQSFHIQRGKSGNGRAVGQVQVYDETGTFIEGFGSGSLIRTADGDGFWFLTAAHVIDGADFFQVGFGDFIDNTDPEFLSSPATFGEVYQPVAWYLPDTYNGNVISAEDVALVRLEQAPPADLKRLGLRSDNSNLTGSIVDIYGYGNTGTGATGQVNLDGRKRAGRNLVDGIGGPDNAIATIDFDVATIDSLYSPIYELDYLFQNYTLEEIAENPNLEPRLSERDQRIAFEYMIAQGDSGGPWVTGDDIVAVNSFGFLPFGFTDLAGAVLVEPWIPWIEAVVADVESGGNTSTVVVDGVGVVAGAQGMGVGPSATGDDGGGGGGPAPDIANARYYTELLRQFYEEGKDSLLLQEKAELVGAVNRNQSLFSNLSTAAQRVGLPADATLQEVLAEIEQTLDEDFGPELERLVRTVNPNLTPELLDSLAAQYQSGEITLQEFEDATLVWIDNTDSSGLFLGLAAPATEPIDPVDPPFPDELPPGALPGIEGPILPGDANSDGVVDLLDFDILAQNFGDENGAYDTGDFNGDFAVDLLDFDILAQNFGASSPGTVPEPASAAALALLGFLTRRRRA